MKKGLYTNMQRGKAQTKLTGGYNYKMLIKRCMGTFLLERVSYFFLFFFLRNEKKKKKSVTDLTFMQLVINGSLRLSLRLDGTGCAARYKLRRRRRERRCPLTTPYRYLS